MLQNLCVDKASLNKRTEEQEQPNSGSTTQHNLLPETESDVKNFLCLLLVGRSGCKTGF
jgi:hypothetical protein